MPNRTKMSFIKPLFYFLTAWPEHDFTYMFIPTIFSKYSKSGKFLSKSGWSELHLCFTQQQQQCSLAQAFIRYTYLRLEVIFEVRLEMLELNLHTTRNYLI
jgi:hypothetical protein